MFRKVSIPVLGVIENMSYFLCPDNGKRYDIFGHGGARAKAEEMGVPFLGELPLDPRVAQCGDAGEPIVRKYPDAPVARAYADLAGKVLKAVSQTERQSDLPSLQL